MSELDKFSDIKKNLNDKSPSFCLAKWLQVSIHLENGTTHSCHHPDVHKIPLNELKHNPTALHNTEFKKRQRQLMLDGKRPRECHYCWVIEDNAPDSHSDRIYKSADSWAYPHMNKVLSAGAEGNIIPTYLEVSFGNECNFKCAYCSPTVSSGILSEFLKFGHYKANPYFKLEHLKEIGEYPYSKDETNPYVDAFWKWWPELKKNLEVFRITGGEPLLHQDTFKILESIIENPMPGLNLAVNSNLSVPEKTIDRFLNLSKKIISNNLVKKYEIYTSLDSSGTQAEYIRFGLDIDRFLMNVTKVLEELPDVKIVFMCTFSALSLPGFEKFLGIMRDLKLRYRHSDSSPRVLVSISVLRQPHFLSIQMLPKRYSVMIEKSLNYMLRFAMQDGDVIFTEYEISQLRRILDSFNNQNYDNIKKILLQRDFFSFITEYDFRKGTDLEETFPEFSTFVSNFKNQGFDS